MVVSLRYIPGKKFLLRKRGCKTWPLAQGFILGLVRAWTGFVVVGPLDLVLRVVSVWVVLGCVVVL